MARKKLERKQVLPFVDFDQEELVVGKVIDYREITTKFGAGMVIEMTDKTSKENKLIMESAGLKGFDWSEFVKNGDTIEIFANGWGKGKNGRFREFEVYLLD